MSDSKMQIVDGQLVSGEFKPVNREFSIKQSAHAIHVLSTSLYSRPIEAIVRELSCNAVDAHISACNETVPFEVGLRGGSIPWKDSSGRERTDWTYIFSVRDFGTGLAPEDLERLYTTYFDSTKQQGEGFIGSFGLGSKSPFAYTSRFYITDRFFGVKHEYMAEVDEDTRIPTLTKLSEEVTGELQNGIEIKFAVQDKLDDFKAAVMTVLPWFGDSVVLTGDEWDSGGDYHRNRSFSQSVEKVDLRGERVLRFKKTPMVFDLPNVMIKKEHYDGYNTEALVLLNKVCYRLDLNRFQGKIPASLSKVSFILKLPVGSIDVTPSREELHYSKRTIETIVEVMSKANDEIKECINEKLSSLSDYELRWQYHQLYEKFGRAFLQDRYERNGIVFRFNNRYDAPEHKIWTKRNTYRRGRDTVKYTEAECDSASYGQDLLNTLHVILDNETDRPKSRIEYHLADKPSAAVVRVFKNRALYDEYEKELLLPAGTITPVLLSEMERPPRAPRAKRGSGPKLPKAFKPTPNGEFGGSWSGVSSEEIEDVENAVYIPLMHWQGYVYGGKINASALVSNIREYTKDYSFYGIKVADVEIFSKLSNWMSIEDVLEECCQELTNSLSGTTIYEGGSRNLDVLMEMKLNSPLLLAIDSYQNIVDTKKANVHAHSNLYKMRALAQYLPTDNALRKPTNVTIKSWDSIYKPFANQFPFLDAFIAEKHYASRNDRAELQKLVLQYLEEQVKLYGANGERRIEQPE